MKQRLDQALVERGWAESRTRAQALIMSGAVYVEGRRCDKPGWRITDEAEAYVEPGPRYVSRAGEKLASANDKFGLGFVGARVLDVGASTGGFSDYALQQGAASVYAVDTGTNQLHEKLRANESLVVMVKSDIRDVELPGPVDIAMVDVSFISLRQVLPNVAQHVKSRGYIIAMCKPQFEAGVMEATKHNGVIKNDRLRRDILKQFETWLRQNGFMVIDKADSGIKGAKGNVERFYLLEGT
jgi:23S rRNA (cytidine1920-2'-O)/16S rRNA (cytidine1409-2'-O)-methyltransferase